MDLNLNQNITTIITALILFVLPLILLIIGSLLGIKHVLFYLISIIWFSMGLIFYTGIKKK
jgi:hypothetical protein